LRGKIIKDEGIVNLPAYMTTGYIKVGKHPIIVVSQKENTYDFVRAYTTYDENKNKIKTWADKYNYGTVLNLEPEAKYVRISTDNNAEQLQVEYGREPTDYVEYEEKKVLKEKYIPFETVGNDDNEILYVNEWYGKKATFNGDSIT